MFKVAIVGRPNVGKSTLFNRLCRMRRAIVGDEPGITRDRLYGRAEWFGKTFEVIDTGGIIPRTESLIPAKTLEQARVAIEEADLVLFVMDTRAGITPLDQELAEFLRPLRKTVFVLANKADTPQVSIEANQFYELGWDKIYPVSAEHGVGISELMDDISALIPSDQPPLEEERPDEIRVAIIGRPNVGKSLLVNRLVGAERVIVSDIPGTTRDAIDTLLTFNDQTFRIIDTAGIRRKGKTKAMAEKLSVVMARKHLRRADVALIVLDAVEGPTKLDATIAGYADQAGCSIIIVVNKWDLAKKDERSVKAITDQIRFHMKFLEYAPVVTVSALTGTRVLKLLDYVKQAAESRKQRVATGPLNQFFNKVIKNLVLTANPKRKFEVKYITQIKASPPTFALFTSTRDKLHFSTERFIINKIRDQFGFYATPIKLLQR